MWSQYSIPAVERMGNVDYADELTVFSPVLAIGAMMDGIEDGIIMKKEAIDRGMGAYILQSYRYGLSRGEISVVVGPMLAWHTVPCLPR